jgi:hypothetical protein
LGFGCAGPFDGLQAILAGRSEVCGQESVHLAPVLFAAVCDFWIEWIAFVPPEPSNLAFPKMLIEGVDVIREIAAELEGLGI